jgi:exonuclease VII large subunit
MSLENFFGKVGRDVSHEQEQQVNTVLNKYSIATYKEKREYLKKIREKLYEKLKDSSTLTKIFDNPGEHIDNTTIDLDADIKKQIAKSNQEIDKVTIKIKNIEKLQKLKMDHPKLN